MELNSNLLLIPKSN